MNVALSRILVPVDFSPHSEAALRYATALASRLEASVELLHVADDRIARGAWTSEVPIPDLSGLLNNLIADAEGRLERYRVVARHPRVRTVAMVRTGQPAPTITEHAMAGGIDLIVIGTHGRSGLAHLLMGSVAEHVVRHAPCPVLTVREAATTGWTLAESATLGFALGHGGTSRE